MTRILFCLVLLVSMPAWAGSKHHNTDVKNDVSIDVNNRPEARSESRSEARTESRADSDVKIGDTATGDQTTITNYEATRADNLPGAPASVYTDACGSGVSISAPGGGGTIGNNEAVCLYLAMANAANTLGTPGIAQGYLFEAERLMERRTLFTRIPPFKWFHFDAWPVVGGFFR
jgi:hypothetical protein